MEIYALLVIGVCVFFNFAIIISKFKRKRYLDATIDLITFVCISSLFNTGLYTLIIGTIASACLSIYLMIFPPKLPKLPL